MSAAEETALHDRWPGAIQCPALTYTTSDGRSRLGLDRLDHDQEVNSLDARELAIAIAVLRHALRQLEARVDDITGGTT